MKGLHKISHKIENEIFIMQLSDHELITHPIITQLRFTHYHTFKFNPRGWFLYIHPITTQYHYQI